jgi:2,4-dienoyl-CoA reductase-like NADH-dependent reductase (Old Yellow Enzyme family)
VKLKGEQIAKTMQDYAKALITAIDISFDGVEFNGDNGNHYCANLLCLFNTK